MLDEPTEGIMPKLVTQIRHEIADIAKRGISVLLVEQNLRTALRLANRVYLMERGQIVHEGTADSLQASPRHRSPLSWRLSQSPERITTMTKHTDHTARERCTTTRRSFLQYRACRRRGLCRVGAGHVGICASGRADRHRPSLRTDRRLRIMGLLAQQMRTGRHQAHQRRRWHRRPQARTGNGGHRVQSGRRRSQAALADPTQRRGLCDRLRSLRRHAGLNSGRDRAQDHLLFDR